MTLFIADVASYQGPLRASDVKRAGFGAVNVKISHGLGVKSVHPDARAWIHNGAGLAVCTFHFLTGEASGFAQARHAYARMQDLDVPDGAAHQLDTEADASWQMICDYVTAMRQLRGRPVALYSGRWWWTAAGRGWDASGVSPYLWAAPKAGYLTAYPGDTSPHWAADYAGASNLAVMQHAVGPLTFPDGSHGSIDVSKSAIRDPAVWSDLTGRRTGMTNAPQSLRDERRLWLDTIPGLDPLAVGIVGDDNHTKSGSSYHLGKSALRPDSYTITESARDRRGLSEDASAIDVGYWEITVGGKKHTLRTYSVWLVRQCEAGAPDTLDIREVIYSPDGKVVKRWDREGKRSTGDDSHLSHTHRSDYRDSTGRDKTALLRRYFMEIGLIEGEDDMTTKAEFIEWLGDGDVRRALAFAVLMTDNVLPAPGSPTTGNTHWAARSYMENTYAAATSARDRVMALLPFAQAEAAEGPEQIADAVMSRLTAPGASVDDVGAALAAAFGDRASAVADAITRAAQGRV